MTGDPDDWYRDEGIPRPGSYAHAIHRTLKEARRPVVDRAPATPNPGGEYPPGPMQSTQENPTMTPERKGQVAAFLTIRSDMPRPKDAPEDWTPRALADQEAEDWRTAGYTARVYSRTLSAEGARLNVWCVLVREPADLAPEDPESADNLTAPAES